jgi:metal-responsive CopG/Arc/MetJ family transcriptional regulator
MTSVILFPMKTAVSIPDPVFNAAEELAAHLGVSRSQLYSRALSEYLEDRLDRRVTERLNEVYAGQSSELDPTLARLQSVSLPRDEW